MDETELTLEFVKNYLHVDFNEDDQYIILIISAAKEYIENAVGEYDESSAINKVLALALISEMYEKRLYTVNEESEKSYIIKSMVHQIRLKRERDDNE